MDYNSESTSWQTKQIDIDGHFRDTYLLELVSWLKEWTNKEVNKDKNKDINK